MQPPLNFTSVPNLNWFIFAVAALVCLYWLRALRLAREGAKLFLWNLSKAYLVFCFSMMLLTAMNPQIQLQQTQVQLVSGFIGFVLFFHWQKTKRSRYISKSTRRTVIERDLKGEEYDSQKHHIDHRWPFSRGGSHTTDNLRVIREKKNLQKGARRPGLHEMW